LPKRRDGKPLGKKVEIEYDVVDLPAWDFDQLLGGPQLRMALDILKRMLEGHEDDFAEAFLPLLEIADQEQQIELSKELLQFVDKAFRAHNRKVDELLIKNALKPIFKEKAGTMIKSIFDEKFDEGVAVGEARGKAVGTTEGQAKMLAKYFQVFMKWCELFAWREIFV
jgi:hypothetical protein